MPTFHHRSSRPLFVALLLSALSVGVGCSSAPKSSDPVVNEGGTLIGLDDDRLTAIWENWTPSEGPSTPSYSSRATAFDYWQITDADYIDTAWAAVFAVVQFARNETDPAFEDTYRTLMTVLEDDTEGERRFDLTFVAAAPGSNTSWEGVIARVYREKANGAAPGIAVELRRPEGGAQTPTSANVWFFSSYAEARSVTLDVDKAAGGWDGTFAEGIVREGTRPLDADPAIVAVVLQQVFWTPFVASSYMDTTVERRDVPLPTPRPHPVAAGLELGDRDIDQVYSDTVFPPRLTAFPVAVPSASAR